MNILGLDTYNVDVDNYDSILNSTKQNLMSQAQFKTEELRQKGEGFLEIGPLAELAAGKAFSMSGVTLQDIQNIPNVLSSDLTNAVQAVKNTASDAIDQASSTIDSITDTLQSLRQSLGEQYDALMNPVAGRLNTEVDPEFGISDDTAMNLLNQSAFKNISSSFSKIGGDDNEMINLSGMYENQAAIGSHSGAIGDAPIENVAENVGTDVAENVGSSVGETALSGALETAGVALDATGIGAIAGVALGIAGAVAGGYSLYKGFEDIFRKSSDDVQLPNLPEQMFQAS